MEERFGYTPIFWRYDSDEHQIVALAAAAEGEGVVEVARLDAAQWSDDDKQRMRDRRDPDKSLPEPGEQAVTRRS